MQFDVDAIRSGLTAHTVIARYQLDVRRRARDEVEGSACATRVDHSRRCFVLNTDTGLWQCFACGTAGDLIAFVMAYERKEFTEALPVLAELAGVRPGEPPDPAVIERRKQQRNVVEENRRISEANSRAVAIDLATRTWEGLARDDQRGRAYLAKRGLRAACFPWLVRYQPNGDPAIALRTSDDRIVNVVTRHVAGEVKVRGMKGGKNAGTFVHALTDLTPCDRDAVLVEGWADSLTAIFAWPGARVFGAHGAGELPKLAPHIARRVKQLGGRLRIVPHDDQAGMKATQATLGAVLAVGLVNGINLEIVELGAHKDLNDAWCAGWRP